MSGCSSIPSVIGRGRGRSNLSHAFAIFDHKPLGRQESSGMCNILNNNYSHVSSLVTILNFYKVVHLVVDNLLLTAKHKFHHRIYSIF